MVFTAIEYLPAQGTDVSVLAPARSSTLGRMRVKPQTLLLSTPDQLIFVEPEPDEIRSARQQTPDYDNKQLPRQFRCVHP